MKVSIITVCYNSADTVLDTLQSVARQDYGDIEHVIVDGGSNDETMAIVAGFPHVRVQVSEKDSGIYFAMNKGLQMASGDIVCFLNSDDWYTRNDVISLVVRQMQAANKLVVYGDLQYVSRENINRIARTWRSGVFNRKSLYYGWMPPHPAFFARTEVYNAVGNFNTNLGNSADYELMLRILLKYEFDAGYLPLILVKMRRGGFSNAKLLHRFRANREDFLAWQINGLKPGWLTRYLKPLRKIPQFFIRW